MHWETPAFNFPENLRVRDQTETNEFLLKMTSRHTALAAFGKLYYKRKAETLARHVRIRTVEILAKRDAYKGVARTGSSSQPLERWRTWSARIIHDENESEGDACIILKCNLCISWRRRQTPIEFPGLGAVNY